MTGDETLIQVENISKKFCRSLKRSLWYGIQDLYSEICVFPPRGRSEMPLSSADISLRSDEFWAVKDVSFDLRRGECIGLIGRNGAGKTTLLKMLNGLIKPDTGRIMMRGNIGGLIALGAGFNPLLTGIENIHVNAEILGYNTSRNKRLVEEIIDFSGIGEFVNSPVQTYSSGMQVRLGFAIATCIGSIDILILDEVLAVGDDEFQSKCHNKVKQLLVDGACAIFVSHSPQQVLRYCKYGVFLRKGSVEFIGSARDALARYQTSTEQHGEFQIIPCSTKFIIHSISPFADGKIRAFLDRSLGITVSVFNNGPSIEFDLEIIYEERTVGYLVHTIVESICIPSNTNKNIDISLPTLQLRSCSINIAVGVWEKNQTELIALAKLLNQKIAGSASAGILDFSDMINVNIR